jgi:hypothetical protein
MVKAAKVVPEVPVEEGALVATGAPVVLEAKAVRVVRVEGVEMTRVFLFMTLAKMAPTAVKVAGAVTVARGEPVVMVVPGVLVEPGGLVVSAV